MSIQIDNGEFTRIHNDILDGLAKSQFTALEFRCLFFLVRMTYGWQKKEDAISLSQWTDGIGIDGKNRGNILNTLNGLVHQGVIYMRSNGNNRPATWGLNKAYFEKQTVMQLHNSVDDELEPTVIPQHNSGVMPEHNSFEPTVMQPHNTTVIPQHNSLAETVMQPHNHQRKILKKELKKEDIPATQPALREKVPTPQQEMFGAVCEAIGWDYKTLSKEDQGQIAQAVGILTKANYTVDDIRRFMTEVWFNDWRWEKEHQHPTLKQLRQEIGKIRSSLASVAPATAKKEKGINGFRDMLAEQGIHI